MHSDATTRRAFLRATGSAGAAFLLSDIVQVREALAWAASQRDLPPPQSFRNLTARQAATLDAIARRIIPSDDGLPGAAEAGAIHYIDRAIEGFASASKPVIEKGIADIDAAAAQRWPGTASFADLTGDRQDQLLREIEQDPFFRTVRLHTVIGTFAQPSYGGNQDHIGWTLIGQGTEPLYQPPFGSYDGESGGNG